MSDEKTLIFGIHALTAALHHEPEILAQILFDSNRRDTRMQNLLELARRRGVKVQASQRATLDQLSHGARHQGVIARLQTHRTPVRQPTLSELFATTTPDLILVLDGITDPHNLGACLRTADAAGVDAVIIPSHRSAGLGATVRNVASGAAETVPLIQVTNLARSLHRLQEHGLWLIGTAEQADTAYLEVDLSVPCAIILGSEDKGLRRLTREVCDRLVSIPMAGTVSSLNVSVAAGILLFEALRQRTAS